MAKKPFDLLDVERALGGAAEAEEPRRRTAVFVEEAADAISPRAQEEINGYVILDYLGSGAHSDVYRGRHLYLDTPCAVKILKDELSSTEAIRRRFHREAQAIAKLDHPNVVGLMTYGETSGGRLAIVLEYLEGRTLLQIVEQEGRLSGARLRELAAQVARGLAAIHALGLVHRDVKPGNVMVVPNGGWEQAKVLDLGVVRFIDREDLTHLTRAGIQLGTPAYMAPEQVASAEVGPPADWYAFGVMLHFLSVGALPQRQRPDLKALGSLAPLVEKLLDPDPSKRPGLDEVLEGLKHRAPRRTWSFLFALGFVTVAASIITATMLMQAPEPIVRVVSTEELEPLAPPPRPGVAPRASEAPPPVATARVRPPKTERKRRPPAPPPSSRTSEPSEPSGPQRIARALRDRGLRREDVRHLEGAPDLAAAIERVEIDARMVNARLDRILGKLRRLGERADPATVTSLEAIYLDLRKRTASDRSARPERMMEAEELERRIDGAVSREPTR